MDEDNVGWGKGQRVGWEPGGGEQWRGGKMRNICNNMNNKDLF